MQDEFNTTQSQPPVKAGWICLFAAWTLFIVPIPGLGMIGWALNLAALVIAIIVMAKGRVGTGVAQLVCAIVVSPIVYFIGLGILGHVIGSGLRARSHHFI